MIPQRQFPQTDIYGITASAFSLGRSNQEVVKLMLEAGIKLVQYREKEFTIRRKYHECLAIRELCTAYNACFIVNDGVDLALTVEADGVHIGQDDLPAEKTRELIGGKMLLGLSIASPQQADEAVKSGVVDYLGVGPIYETTTKKDVGMPIGMECLDYVTQHYRIPVVAIGGIKQDNVAEVIKHGATCVAMITEIVSAEDIGGRISTIRKTIAETRAHSK